MSLVKWTDRSVLPQINSMFDNFFNDNDGFFRAISQGTSIPAVNVLETDETYELDVAAPGKSKDDFKIEVDNNVLCISSENENESESTEKNYTRKEYSYSSFSRSFTLPENAQEEDIKANYENGVLKIAIPKKEQSKTTPKSIPVG